MTEYLIYLENRGLSPSTRQRQLAHAKAFTKWLVARQYTLAQLGYRQMIHYIEEQRQKGIGENTLVHYLRYLYIYFDYLIAQEKIKQHPLQHLQLRSRTRQRAGQQIRLQSLLNETQLQTLYRCYTYNKRLNKRHLNMLGLILYQGIAAGEALYLQRKHIDLEQARIFVPTSRKYQQRYLPLKATQILSLSRYIEGKDEDDFLFIYANQQQATNSRTALCMQIRLELQRNQQSDIHFKNLTQLRSSRISLWVSSLGLRKAQYLAGHSNIVSTQRYKTTDMDTLKQQINQFHPLK